MTWRPAITTAITDAAPFLRQLAESDGDPFALWDWHHEHGTATAELALRYVATFPLHTWPRLFAAYQFECDGDTARAEFIRTQVELAGLGEWPHEAKSWCDCRFCTLRRRERELLLAHWDGWLGWDAAGLAPMCRNLHGPGSHGGGLPVVWFEFTGGYPSRVTLPLAALVGEQRCERCNPPGSGSSGVPLGDGLSRCASCKGKGRLPPIAGRLAAVAPLTEITVTDREPLQLMNSVGWRNERYWTPIESPADAASILDEPLFDLLTGGEALLSVATQRTHTRRYPSRDAANADLSHALVNYCRGLAPGFTHEVKCGRCKGKADWYDALTGDGKCFDCTGAATRPGLPMIETWPEGSE